ncbi:tetratricopeptide repeat protein [Isosphaeraceae bacterium EP7]
MRSRPRWPGTIYLTLAAVALAGLAAGAIAWRRGAEDPEHLAMQALADFKAGRHGQAEAALARLGRMRPPTVLDRMLRAQVALTKDLYAEALVELRQVPDDHPATSQAKFQQGQIELKLHHLRAAEEALLAALKLDPNLVQAHRSLIYIYGMQRRRPELHARFLALSKLTPLGVSDVTRWCITCDESWVTPESEVDLARFVKADPGDRFSRLALAARLRLAGRLDESEAALAPLPATDPEAQLLRAQIGQERGVGQGLEASIAGIPDGRLDLERFRGRAAMFRHDAKAAVRHFRAAHEADPHDQEALGGLARALTMSGDPAAAQPYLAAMRRYAELSKLLQEADSSTGPKPPDLMLRLGKACEAVQKLEEARAWYRLAIERDPLDSEAQKGLFRLGPAAPTATP